jgi:acyl dehydratase
MKDEIPAEVQALIGVSLYEEQTEFDIEMGYVYNTCAAVENGNPLFWDKEVAAAITGGQITPPTMLSVWFRPHYWAPGASVDRKALQAHFDLKEKLDLPEAVVTTNETIFGEPVRIGDILTVRQTIKSISDIKKTKLGEGRFWVIEVETTNQHGEHVGTDIYTCLGYRRPEQ